MEIIGVFPTPVLRLSLDRDFSAEEVREFSTLKQNSSQRPSGSFRSINAKVLDQPALSNLKNDMTKAFDIYLNEIIKVKDKVSPQLSLSWINWQNGEQTTHIHKHPNSYLSAVLYIEAYEDDKIEFFKSDYEQIELTSKDYDIYNCKSYWISVKSKDIIVFPSYLSHGVEQRKVDKGTRVSLAVNMFPTGTLGTEENLTELII